VVALQFSRVAKNPNWTADLHFVMAIYIHLELNLGNLGLFVVDWDGGPCSDHAGSLFMMIQRLGEIMNNLLSGKRLEYTQQFVWLDMSILILLLSLCCNSIHTIVTSPIAGGR
jgi:hypothetical protein